MGAGLPISAITASKEIMDSVPAGTIGGTYCGNPLSCASALKAMEIYKRDNYAKKAEDIGLKVRSFFEELMKDNEEIGDIRGIGSMLGIEFVKPKREKSLLLNLYRTLLQMLCKTVCCLKMQEVTVMLSDFLHRFA